MRAARHVHLADPSHRPHTALRRSVGLALAAVAALVTLLLPAPAVARPVNAALGSVASTGGLAAGGTAHSERRTHRADHRRSPGSGDAVSAPATDGSDASSLVRSFALGAPSHGSGPSSLAALPSAPRPSVGAVPAAAADASPAALSAAGSGGWSSRAPPAV
jgi:hypothetical protein